MTSQDLSYFISLLRCPSSGEDLKAFGGRLTTESGRHQYRVNDLGIPLFAEEICSAEGRIQQEHYDKVSEVYLENLDYPHTQEYMAYLDDALLRVVGEDDLGDVAEICCGSGEAIALLGQRMRRGIGVDVSQNMLATGRGRHKDHRFFFVQGDATNLPLKNESVDNVVMLGGVHHVNDRLALFSEIHRIMKPGGRFFWREPVSDLFLWRWLRAVVYRMSPALEHTTEHPLLYKETVPILERTGLSIESWRTYGFLGFCLFMNSDVLVFNRLFRFLPGIRNVTRAFVKLDQWTLRLPGLGRGGLQVVGVARKGSVRCT